MKYLRPYILLLLVLSLLLAISPSHPVDPWELVNPRKLVQLIFTLTVLQILGALLMTFFKGSVGGGAYGFFGGLISSTALTASLAKQSQKGDEDDIRLLSLSYLSALFIELTSPFAKTGTSTFCLSSLIIAQSAVPEYI
jgi:uncharacterized membrane protein (DUF4010 family)